MKRMIFCVVLLIMAIIFSIANKPNDASEYQLYVVKSSDTLWDISREITPDSRDLRHTVYEIREKNGLKDGVIYAGQRLVIPVYEEE